VHLANFPLSTSRSYQALSYTWGDTSEKATVKINGRRVTIQKSLQKFLAQIHGRKHKSLPLLFWADAICIDQRHGDDQLNERHHQVQIMRSIFSQANTVLCCLDEEDLPVECHNKWQNWLATVCADVISTDPLRAFLVICHRYDHVLDAGTSGTALRAYCAAVLAHLLSDSHSEVYRRKMCVALSMFINVGYWKRVWTVQEFALARRLEVYCRRVVLETADLRLLFYFLGEYHVSLQLKHPAKDLQQTLVALDKIRNKSINFLLFGRYHFGIGYDVWSHASTATMPLSLGETIARHVGGDGDHGCTELRDYVYGFLGLSSPIQVPQDFIDYRRPLLDLFGETIILSPEFNAISLATILLRKVDLRTCADGRIHSLMTSCRLRVVWLTGSYPILWKEWRHAVDDLRMRLCTMPPLISSAKVNVPLNEPETYQDFDWHIKPARWWACPTYPDTERG
jgi:hypothetical protein